MDANAIRCEIAQYLRDKYYREPVQPDEMTAEQVAAVMGVSQRGAKDILKREVDAGVITCREARNEDGHVIVVYRMTQSKS